MTVAHQSLGRRELLTGRRRRDSPYWVRVHRTAMACRFEVTLSGDDLAQIAVAHEALAEASRLEALLSVFRETSELTRVNRRGAHEPVAVGAELFEIVQRCSELHRDTGGAFDITTTPLSRCWGFLKRQGRVPSPSEIDAARALVDMQAVELDEPARTIRLRREGIELNLGSIGKGYAVHRIASLLSRRRVRHALVSAGGSSVVALGGPIDGWPIDVTSNQVSGRCVARLRLRGGAMATSGAGEQYVDAQGQRLGHVLDPRTGWPSQGLVSATVVTRDGAVADALATAFLVEGVDLARGYCDSHPQTLALLTVNADSTRPLVVGRYDRVVVEDM